MKVTVSRKAHFNAAHRLYRKDWSEEKNNNTGCYGGSSVLTAKWKYSDNKRDSPDSSRSLMKGILEKIK